MFSREKIDELISLYKDQPDKFIEEFCGIKLKPIQKLMLKHYYSHNWAYPCYYTFPRKNTPKEDTTNEG